MGVGHYENFPVASWLLPAGLRAPVRAIYRFARTADDIVDEGDDAPEARLGKLAGLSTQLDAIEAGRTNAWPELADAVRRHALPVALLRDLLSAFAQDVTVRRYSDYGALFDYCRRSANPIGRLLLHLFRHSDADSLARSDAVCTGLQLTNFWQDVAIDYAKGRVYLPRAELDRFGVDEAAIKEQRVDAAWTALMTAQTRRARAMLESGGPLADALAGRIGFELRLVIQGGLRILERVDVVRGDVFRYRPVLRPADWLLMGVRALAM
jgi:squalene synthase HpnC